MQERRALRQRALQAYQPVAALNLQVNLGPELFACRRSQFVREHCRNGGPLALAKKRMRAQPLCATVAVVARAPSMNGEALIRYAGQAHVGSRPFRSA